MKSLAIKSLLALLIAFVTAFISSLQLCQNIELSLADLWFNLRGKIAPPKQVAVLAIDERSYDQLKVPLDQAWPRMLHAELLERLADYGVKRVVFDILFIDPSANSEADRRFAQAIAKVPTVLGVEASTQQVSGAGGSYVIEDVLSPFEPFRKAATGTGLVGLPSDSGMIRRFLTARSEQTAEIPSLAEAGAGVSPADGTAKPGERDLINYYGAPRTLPIFSYYQVLDQEKSLPKQMLEGKTVYIGLLLRTDIGPAQKDIFASPFGGNIFGVEVHATAAANLLDKSWIRRASALSECLWSALFVAIITVVLLSVSPIIGALIVIAVALVWAGGSLFLFHAGYFLPGVVPVTMIAPLVLLAATLYYYFVVRRSEQAIRSNFELYLSPETVKSLKDSGSASLGGEKLWATALFTDIEGFTGITEEMPAERVAQMLNDYFTEVMDVVFRNQGTLIKFIGDAVFVIWGAPLKIANHAERAVQTALAIDAEVRRFNESRRFPALLTRIGVNTGPMLVGNLGSKKRFDYTAIGDSVNLASRIEGINKYLGTSVLFSEATRRDAGDAVQSIHVGAVQVVGKKETIKLYTAYADPISGGQREVWAGALDSFAHRRWQEARTKFEEIRRGVSQLAPVAERYIGFISDFEQSAPGEGWSGELVFKEK